ncbi:MAG: helix-turn-helix domain-containing protein [Marmoricola sp.]
MVGALTEREALLTSPVRRRVVELLRDLPSEDGERSRGLTANDLATRLDLHVTTVRFHLDQLVAADVLETEFLRGRVGRPRKVYRVLAGSLRGAKVDRAHAALTELLLASWQEQSPEGTPLTAQQAGERWVRKHVASSATPPAPALTPGAWLGKVGQALDLLTPWGYTREVRTLDEGRTVELNLVDCPFLAMAHDHPEVVCGVHRGLLREAMHSTGESDVQVGLQPFVAPGRCRATMTRTADFGAVRAEDEAGTTAAAS